MAFLEFKNVSWTINQMSKMVERGTIDFEFPIQRKSGMWNLEGKSLLVYSMVAHIPIPPIYFISHKVTEEELVENDKLKVGERIRQLLDGKQRLTNLYSFMNNEYKLHENTPNVTLEGYGEEFVLANKTFDELDEEVKHAFLNRNLLTYTVDGDEVSHEQIEFVFLLMNNGVALKQDQKLKSVIGFEMADKLSEYDTNEFIHKCSFSANNFKMDAHISAILQYLMLREVYDDSTSFKPTAFSIADITKYANHLRSRSLEERVELFNMVDEVFEYGAKVLEDETKKVSFLKRANFPMFCFILEHAMNDNVEPSLVKEWFNSFLKEIKEEENHPFFDYKNQGTTKRDSFINRYDVMLLNYNRFVRIKNEEKETVK